MQTRSFLLRSVPWLLLLPLCGPAWAQDDRDEDEVIEQIVVTGSRIGDRSALETAVPVDVLRATELASSGAVNAELGQALAVLTPSFNFPRQSNSGTSDLVRAGQLRGLSPDQMLVLVNGKRRHTSAVINSETKIGRGTAAVDFNTIPLNAVERIEVLRDGAGAIYGSDAIAGVVNVILDDSPGFETRIGYGAHVTELEPVDDDITDGQTLTADASYGWAVADGFVKVGTALSFRSGTNRSGFDQVPFFVEQTEDNLALQGMRNYAEGDPDVDQVSIWYNTEIPAAFGAWYGFGTFTSRESEGGGAFYRYPDGASNVRAIYDEGFRPQTRADDFDIGNVLGLRARAETWELDASISYGRNEFEFGVENSLNASLGPESPTSFESGTFTLQQLGLNLDALREFDTAAFNEPVVLAVGIEYRREDYETDQGDPASYIAGPFDGEIGAQAAPGLTPEDEADVDRDVYSAYAELGLELTDRLFVEIAGRFEDYSDFGSAATGKLTGRLELTETVALRGAVSNSFRAPNLAQLGFSDTTLNFGPNRTLVRTRTLRGDDPIARALGAEALDEERSVNFSAGLVARLARLTLTLDVFRIDVDDRITLSERLFSQPLTDFIQSLPGGANTESVRFFTNAVDTRTEGFDLILDYEQPWLGGDLSLSAAYNYSSTDVESVRTTTPELAAIDPSLSLIGVEELNTLETAAPDNKLILTARWSGQRWRLLGRLSRFGSAVRVFNFGGGFEPRQEYGEEYQLDLEAAIDLTDRLSLTAGAANVLDEYPDLSSPDINFFGNLPYDILSPIGVNGRYVYARAAYRY